MSENTFIEQLPSVERTFNFLRIKSKIPLHHDYNNAGLVIEGAEGTAIITKSLRVPNTFFKQMNFDDGYQADGRILTSSTDGTAHWAKKFFDTNDVPELLDGPSDNKIHTFYNIGIGTNNPLHLLHVHSNLHSTIDVECASGYISQLRLMETPSNWGGFIEYDGDDWNNGKDHLNLGLIGSGTKNIHMTIERGGNVGIGITNPTKKLHVLGDTFLEGNLNVSIDTSITGNTTIGGYATISGDTTIGGNTSISGDTTIGGDTSISGDLDVTKNIHITGNLYVDGTTVAIESEIVTIADTLIRLGSNNPGNTRDLGFYGQYVDIGVTKFSGFFINYSDNNRFHLFRDLTIEPTISGIIDTSSSSGYDLADLKLGFIHCDDGITVSNNGILTIGDNSTMTMGNDGAITIGNDSVMTMGNNSAMTMGDDSTIIMGDNPRIKYGPNTSLRLAINNGDDKIFITKDGNIGIGVTEPLAEIQVKGTIITSDNIGIGVTICDVSLDTDRTDAYRLPVGTVAERPTGKDGLLRFNKEYLIFEGFIDGHWDSMTGGLIDVDRDTYIIAERLPEFPDEDILWFYTNGLPRMVIDNTGNLGLNEDAPTIIFEANSTDGILLPKGTTAQRPDGRRGIIRYNNQLDRFEGYGAGNAWGSLGGVVDIDQDTYITAERLNFWDEDHLWMYTKGDFRMIIRDNGNVGIGVTAPSYPLELFPDTDSKALFGRAHIGYLGHADHASFSHKDVSNSTSYALSQSNDGHTWINSANNKNIEFLQNNQRKAIIQSGNMGINIDSPSEKLEVGGNIRISDTFHIATNEIRARDGSGTLLVTTDMTVNGDFIVNGTTTTINTTNITVDDPLIHLAKNNTSTDTADIGFYGSYPYSGTTEYTGLFRDSSSTDYRYKLFTQLSVAPSATNIVNTAGAGYTKATLELGKLDTGAIDYPANLSFSDSTSGTAHITFATNGYVGIGTTLPSLPFHVNKTFAGNWSTKITNGYANVLIANQSGYGMSINSGVNTSNNANYCLQCRTDFTQSGNTTPYLFTVLNNGFCGINIQNPLDLLHIQGIYHGDGARINCVKIGSWINGVEYDTDAIFAHTNFGTAGSETTASYGYALRQSSVGDTYLNASQGRIIDFRIDDSRVAGIASSGNMGIGAGITAPESLLHVGGSITIDGNLLIKGEVKYVGPISTELKIQDTVIMLASENNGDAFDIGLFGKYVYDGESEFTGLFRDASDKKWKLFTGLVDDPGGPNTIDTESMGFTPDTLVLGDIEAQNVYSNLQIGIGITNPVVAFQIEKTDAIKLPKGDTSERPTANADEHKGYFRYNSELNIFEGFGAGNVWSSIAGGGAIDADKDTYISAEDTTGSDNDQLKFFTADTQRMVISNTGLVGINSSSPSHQLDVNGEVQCISYITISDKRVKKDIKPLHSSICLKNILNIPVYEYRFKDIYRNSCKLKDKKRFGPLAQEVEIQIPDAVETSDKIFTDNITGQIIHIEDFKSIDNNALIAQLIGSIKALANAHVKIDQKYQKEISQLKERISLLENN